MDGVNYAAELAYQRAVLNDREQKVLAHTTATIQTIHQNLATEALRCDEGVAQATNEQQRLAYKEEMAKTTQIAIDLERSVVNLDAKRLEEISHDREKLELLAIQQESAQAQLKSADSAQQVQLLAKQESERQEATTQQQMAQAEARQAEERRQLEARQAEERRQLEVRQREELKQLMRDRGPNR